MNCPVAAAENAEKGLYAVQFHPEANGGPKDTEFLFDRFLNNVKAAKKEVR